MTSKYCIEEKGYVTEEWVPTQYFDNSEDAYRVYESRKHVTRYEDELRDDIRLINLETGNVC